MYGVLTADVFLERVKGTGSSVVCAALPPTEHCELGARFLPLQRVQVTLRWARATAKSTFVHHVWEATPLLPLPLPAASHYTIVLPSLSCKSVREQLERESDSVKSYNAELQYTAVACASMPFYLFLSHYLYTALILMCNDLHLVSIVYLFYSRLV